MSNLEFQCSCCGNAIEVTADQIGYVVYCPNCMAELIVPDLAVPESAPPPDDFQKPPPAGISPFAEQTPSQIIYRDADGNPLITDDVSQAVSGQGTELTETKMALADTLKALQDHQRALADAREELTRRQKELAETNRSELTDTSTEMRETDSALPITTSCLPIGGLPTLDDISGKGPMIDTQQMRMGGADENTETTELPMDSAYVGQSFEASDTEALRQNMEQERMQFRPFFTPHGDFLPFSEDELSEALQYEHQSLFASLEQIYPTPNSWSYSVFALLLESHLAVNLPETLMLEPMPTVFFGGGQKYFEEVTRHQVVFLNIVRRMLTPFGEHFQHALEFHDVHAMVEVVHELDQPLEELYQFMVEFQQVAFPKKEPFPELREMMLGFYDEVRYRLYTVVERLEQRAVLSPQEANRGTINVSLMPHTLHRFNILLRTIPNV